MNEPLAYKLRPTSIKDVIGQKHLVGKDKVIFAEGSTSLEKRQEAIKKFEQGGVILLSSSIFNEGVNIKSMDVLINARCSLSQTTFLQIACFPTKFESHVLP